MTEEVRNYRQDGGDKFLTGETFPFHCYILCFCRAINNCTRNMKAGRIDRRNDSKETTKCENGELFFPSLGVAARQFYDDAVRRWP